MTTAPDAGRFSNYWDKVAELLGGADPKHKTTAIESTAASTLAEEGETNVRKLWGAIGGSRWASPESASDKNWTWRAKNTKEGKASKEVALERKLFDLGGCERWTYQMPTSSGLEGPSVGKRRSIDLVHKTGKGHYSLIDLKCASDHPLYAGFEVLGYGMAYLYARRHLSSRNTAAPEIMSAQRIDLVVLGPRDWYSYSRHKAFFFASARTRSSIRSQCATPSDRLGRARESTSGWPGDRSTTLTVYVAHRRDRVPARKCLFESYALRCADRRIVGAMLQLVDLAAGRRRNETKATNCRAWLSRLSVPPFCWHA